MKLIAVIERPAVIRQIFQHAKRYCCIQAVNSEQRTRVFAATVSVRGRVPPGRGFGVMT